VKLKRLYNGTVRVLRAGREQKFSQRVFDGGIAEGWLSVERGKVTIHGDDGNREYVIVRTPGYYCCHCDASLPDAAQIISPGFTSGMKHVRDEHGDAPSPDPFNPAGYRKDCFYFCINDSIPADESKPSAPSKSWFERFKESF
jgi:hypothetical protein